MLEYPADGRGQRRAQDQKSRPTKDRPSGQTSPSAPAAHSRNIQFDTLPLPWNPYGPTLLSLGDTLTLTGLTYTSAVYFSYVGANAGDLIKQQSIVPVNGSVSIPCNRMGALWINVQTGVNSAGDPIYTAYYCNVQQ